MHHQAEERQLSVAYDIAKVVSNLLSYLNHSINFFLYCLTGQRFRNEIILIVRERRASFLGLDHDMSAETMTTTVSNGRRFTKPCVSAAINDVSSQLMSYGAAHKLQRYCRETEV